MNVFTRTAPANHATGDAVPPTCLLSPVVGRQVYNETGLSIRQQKSELKWTHSRNALQKIASRTQQAIGLRTGTDQVSRFIEHVVHAPNPQRTVTQDPLDGDFRVYTVPVRGGTARLSMDARGQRVNAFPHFISKHPVLDEAITELKTRGWTVRYGTAHAVSQPTRVLTLDAAGTDPGPLVDLLAQLPVKAIGKLAAGRVAKYLHAHAVDLNGGPATVKRLTSLQAYGFDPSAPERTFYDAVQRRVQAPLAKDATHGRFDADQLPGVSLHDATMVMAYRLLHLPVNGILRDRSPRGLALQANSGIDLFVRSYNASLSSFPAYEGTVHRGVNDLPAATVAHYASQVGQVLTEPFPVCSTDRRFGYDASESDVRFVIQSTSGRSLKTLSPFSEVQFPAGSRFRTESVVYEPGTQHRAIPRATIVQTQVA